MYIIASRISFHFDTFVVVFELDPVQSQLEDLLFCRVPGFAGPGISALSTQSSFDLTD